MAHSIKNPDILHWVEDDGKYACIKAVKPTPEKTAFSVDEVTCKNCKKILEGRRLDNHLETYLRPDLHGSVHDKATVWEMIGRAKALEDMNARVELARKYSHDMKVKAMNPKTDYDIDFLNTVLDGIEDILYPKEC